MIGNQLQNNIIDLAHRITGYEHYVILEYIKIKDNNFSKLNGLTLFDCDLKTEKYKSLIHDLYYLNRKIKINKLINKITIV
jgi:hypothetical protein